MKVFIFVESTEGDATAEGDLNLKTGKISNVVYSPASDFFNENKNIEPYDNYGYVGTTGTIILKDKSIDFKIDTQTFSYLVAPDDLNKLHKTINDLGIKLDDLFVEENSNKKKIKP